MHGILMDCACCTSFHSLLIRHSILQWEMSLCTKATAPLASNLDGLSLQ